MRGSVKVLKCYTPPAPVRHPRGVGHRTRGASPQDHPHSHQVKVFTEGVCVADGTSAVTDYMAKAIGMSHDARFPPTRQIQFTR